MPATIAYWKYVLEDLQKSVPLSQYQAWFSNLQFVKTTSAGKKMVVEAQSRFNKEYIENKYKNTFLCSINKYYPKVTQLEFVIKKFEKKAETVDVQLVDITTGFDKHKFSPESCKVEEATINIANTQNQYNSNKNFKKQSNKIPNSSGNIFENTLLTDDNTQNSYSVLPKKNIHNLNTKFNFDSLVVANYNELAVSVAKSIIKQPGTLYNPVFIHSATGLGKTHLLQAIGQKVLEIYPTFNIRYTTTETFLNHYTSCMQKGKGGDFHEYYRSVDLLLIDDIQFIAGKSSTQEVFFHTFNELHQQNKQIIITADRPPKSLGGVEDRLISRFEWGMVLDLCQPTTEDRIAIIRDKAARMRIPLSEEQILQVAEAVQTNIRDIEGVLNQLQARLSFQPGQFLSDEVLERVLGPFVGVINQGMMQFSYKLPAPLSTGYHQLPAPSTPFGQNLKSIRNGYNRVFEVICNHYRINKDELLGKKREKNIVLARQVVMYLLQKKYNLSTPKIGKLLGNRNHTTVIHGCKTIEKSFCRDKYLRDQVNSLLYKV